MPTEININVKVNDDNSIEISFKCSGEFSAQLLEKILPQVQTAINKAKGV